MKKENENQDGMLSEGIAKAKRAVRRSPKSTENDGEKKTGRRASKAAGAKVSAKI